MWRARQARERAELTKLAVEIDDVRPFLELAREIQAEVARIAADPSAHGDLLAELLDRIPQDERMELARRIFAELPAVQRWAVVADIYGDEEIQVYLQAERAVLLAEARTGAALLETVRQARAEHQLDTRRVAPGQVLTLGLFREHDVRGAMSRGHESVTCARRIVLRNIGEGAFQVMEDVFNPNGGYFVTAEYSEETWRGSDRLPAHAVVRVGSMIESHAGRVFDPVLYPGGRADFEVGGLATPGRLHMGFAMLNDIDIFVAD